MRVMDPWTAALNVNGRMAVRVPCPGDWGLEMRDIVRRTWLAIIVGAGSLAGGCALLPTQPGLSTTEVTMAGPAGERTIACRGPSPITDDACRDWGRTVVGGLPAESAEVVRLVLTDRAGVGRCSADFQDADGSIYASASIVCP